MLASGARVILREQFIPRIALTDLATGQATVFLGVPSMYRAMVETRLSTRADLSNVRYLLSCSAPLSSQILWNFHERFGVVLCQHYGSSEVGAAALHSPNRVLAKVDSVGSAIEGVHIRIVDDDGNQLGHDCKGEVVVTSEAVGIGYLIGGSTARSRFEGRDFYSGDIGSLDADGFLRVHGRIDGMINVGGFKISAREVADVLRTHPAVEEAHVAGVPDDFGGQVVRALVIVNTPTTDIELLAHCRGRLADYKVPRRVEVRADKLTL
jgi:long-chain acyl-CoA synthetase